jgi:hypothetical protein
MKKITKAEFEALPESLKSEFKAEGEEYVLIQEDVDGLKKSKADILKEKKDLQDRLTVAEQFMADHQQKESDAANELLIKQGEFKTAQEARDKEWQGWVDAAASEKEALFSHYHRERLQNELVKKGVLPDRAEFLVDKMAAETELYQESETGKYSLRKKGGIGDAAAFDGIIEAAKTATPFFFAASNASGSGASGSQGGGNAKTMPEAQFDAMSPQQQAAFINDGGSPV